MTKVVLLTGGSSGIGAAAAGALADKGCRVYTLSRREYDFPKGKHIAADICNEEQAAAAIEQIIAEAGRLDLVINCAGSGISGAIEFTPAEQARYQLEVNVLGTANITRFALPHLRQSKGRVINISSVAGALPIPFQAWYSASKAAVNAYTLALANEVRPFGISVCAVQPGDIHTPFTQQRIKDETGDDIYGGAIHRAVARMEHDEENGLSTQWLAKRICRIAFARRVRPFYTPGFSYWLFVLLAGILPRSLSNFIVGKLYS